MGGNESIYYVIPPYQETRRCPVGCSVCRGRKKIGIQMSAGTSVSHRHEPLGWDDLEPWRRLESVPSELSHLRPRAAREVVPHVQFNESCNWYHFDDSMHDPRHAGGDIAPEPTSTRFLQAKSSPTGFLTYITYAIWGGERSPSGVLPSLSARFPCFGIKPPMP